MHIYIYITYIYLCVCLFIYLSNCLFTYLYVCSYIYILFIYCTHCISHQSVERPQRLRQGAVRIQAFEHLIQAIQFGGVQLTGGTEIDGLGEGALLAEANEWSHVAIRLCHLRPIELLLRLATMAQPAQPLTQPAQPMAQRAARPLQRMAAMPPVSPRAKRWISPQPATDLELRLGGETVYTVAGMGESLNLQLPHFNLRTRTSQKIASGLDRAAPGWCLCQRWPSCPPDEVRGDFHTPPQIESRQKVGVHKDIHMQPWHLRYGR